MDKPPFESLDQIVQGTAAALSQAGAGNAFRLTPLKRARAALKTAVDRMGGKKGPG